jgi:muconolactone D-isomerase
LHYLVHFVSRVPPDSESEAARDLHAREKARALELKDRGVWTDIRHPVGQPAWSCVFDVSSNDELHQILSGLPMFPYLDIEVVPLR